MYHARIELNGDAILEDEIPGEVTISNKYTFKANKTMHLNNIL